MRAFSLLLLGFIIGCHAQPQFPWQGEWGAFTDAKTMLGDRLSISQCSANACRFSVERASATGHIDTSTDQGLTLLSSTTAIAKLYGGEGAPQCVLQLTRQGSPKPVITVSAPSASCLNYYGGGINITLSGDYPLRSTTPYAGAHRDECYFDNSPARLAICTTPRLSQLESHWQDLAFDYPIHPPTSNDQTTVEIAQQEDTSLFDTCDKDPHPAQCLQTHYTAEINSMQARKDAYTDGTTERGDPAQGGLLAKKIAGSYRHSFKNGDVQGDTYISTDTLTISSVGTASIQFDTELAFYNGHSCSIGGGALFRKDGSFVFDDDPKNKLPEEPLCRLAIIPSDQGVTFKDVTGGCKSYCGARGTLDGASFTFSQRATPKAAAK
jgi:hypothetical protein